MRARRLIVGRLLALMLGGMTLAGCSSVPDAVNPVEWYRGARDMVVGKDDDTTAQASKDNRLSAEADQPPPGADQPIPSVNTVPNRPRVSSAEERDKVASSLIADQQGARRYSGEVIKRQGELPPPASPPRSGLTPSAQQQLPTPDQQASRQPQPAPSTATSSAPAAAGPSTEQVAAAAPTPPPSMSGAPTASSASPAPSSPTPAPALATPASAQRQPPQMRDVAAASPSPPPQAPGQPIRPNNIVIPRENPSAPKLNQVKPYTPPPGAADDYETVYVTGAEGQGGEGKAAPPRRSLAAAAAAGATASAAPSSRGSVQVATIQFANGSSRLSDGDRRILGEVEAQHRQVGGTLRVVGHTAGRAESDDASVSKLRADVVAAELVRLGAAPGTIKSAGVGDSDPKYAESSPNGIAGNRRTEIFIDF